MTTHTTQTLLRAAPEIIYDDLTRPARWREWHHASLGTEAHAGASMRVGDHFREQIRSVGIRKELTWRVLEADPPRSFRVVARYPVADRSPPGSKPGQCSGPRAEAPGGPMDPSNEEPRRGFPRTAGRVAPTPPTSGRSFPEKASVHR